MKRALLTMCFVSGVVGAQTTYDTKSLVDSNNVNTSTVTSTSTVNTNNTNTNTNTSINTNNNINSGTQTLNNNNNMSGSVTYTNNNVNSGTVTYNNNNNSASTSTNTNFSTSSSVNTNNNINTGTMTYNNNNNSTNNNTNYNVNTGTQTLNNNNTNNSVSTSTNTNNNNNASTSNNVNQNIQSGDMTNRNLNDTTITQKVIQPPPTAMSPTMMSGGNSDLCSTGSSSSVQTQIFGVSSGGTVRDLNCERLKLSKTLYDMGMKVAAVSTMCQDRRVFDAMWSAGTPCPFDGKIGKEARLEWEANPHKIPEMEEVKVDDNYKKIGFGAILGMLIFKIF